MATMGESGVSLVIAIRRHILFPSHCLAKLSETAERKHDDLLLWSSYVCEGKTRANHVCSSIAARYLGIAGLYTLKQKTFLSEFFRLCDNCVSTGSRDWRGAKI
jgi:hypothetical protein